MRNIIHKFYLIGILFVAVISAGLVIQYGYFNSILADGTEWSAGMNRDAISARVSGSLLSKGQVISDAAGYAALEIPEDQAMLAYLRKLQEENTIFSSIYYLKTDKTMLNTSGYQPPPSLDLTVRPWYVKAIAEEKLVFTEAFVNASGDKLIMTIACPVYDSDNKLAGVVAGDMEIRDLIAIVNLRQEEKRYSFLIDAKSQVLAYPGYEYSAAAELKSIGQISPELSSLLASGQTGVARLDLDGIDGYLAYGPIQGTELLLASFTEAGAFSATDERAGYLFLIILLSSIFFCALYLLQQKKYFIEPMLSLENDIRSINTDKDIDYRLPTTGRDIFRTARLSINTVLAKLQQLYRELAQQHQALEQTNLELEAYVQQLKASEMELRRQYDIITASEKRNEYLSYHDHLTGIYNRRFCEEEIKRLNTERNLPFSVIMGDVNGLKLANDAFGHENGDLLLKRAAEAMQAACRSDEIIARWGGDEFVILLPGTRFEQAETIIGRIKSASSGERIGALNLSISLGAATKVRADEDIQKILQNAEDNMYANKMTDSEKLTGNVVNTIISTLHEKNPREERHSERVSELSQALGKAAGFTDIEIAKLKVVGLMHDIGKIAIEESILNKPGWFNEEEWKKVRLHSEIGYRILSTVNSLSETAEYVLFHHERWDGRGYPRGLKGDSIPIQSRIVSIADAYDAMTSDSSYRTAVSPDVAVQQLVRNAGSQFDPKLVPLFIEGVLGKRLDQIKG